MERRVVCPWCEEPMQEAEAWTRTLPPNPPDDAISWCPRCLVYFRRHQARRELNGWWRLVCGGDHFHAEECLVEIMHPAELSAGGPK